MENYTEDKRYGNNSLIDIFNDKDKELIRKNIEFTGYVAARDDDISPNWHSAGAEMVMTIKFGDLSDSARDTIRSMDPQDISWINSGKPCPKFLAVTISDEDFMNIRWDPEWGISATFSHDDKKDIGKLGYSGEFLKNTFASLFIDNDRFLNSIYHEYIDPLEEECER